MEIDVHVGRNDRINVGSYTTISPSVNLTIKNVELDKFESVYNKLSMLASVMYTAETKECIDSLDGVVNVNPSIKAYKKLLDEQNFDDMIKDAIKDLKGDDIPF